MPPAAPPAAAEIPAPAAAGLRALIVFFETLSPDSVAQIGSIYAPDARFRDPFNEVQGVPAIARIFVDMFERTRGPRFVITGSVQQGHEAFVTWDFHFGSGGNAMRIQGCSQLHFDAQGRVDVHRDYWDAAGELYEKLPLLGGLMRALKRRLTAH
ncbi:MAG: nuclear transport factor 2 family protein [Rubrivivax sp.]|nr:nuclear transport factor 2 family protein [Rubrivivax sp.]